MHHPETPSELAGRPKPAEPEDPLADQLPGHLKVHDRPLGESGFAVWDGWVDAACPGLAPRDDEQNWNSRADVLFAAAGEKAPIAGRLDGLIDAQLAHRDARFAIVAQVASSARAGGRTSVRLLVLRPDAQNPFGVIEIPTDAVRLAGLSSSTVQAAVDALGE